MIGVIAGENIWKLGGWASRLKWSSNWISEGKGKKKECLKPPSKNPQNVWLPCDFSRILQEIQVVVSETNRSVNDTAWPLDDVSWEEDPSSTCNTCVTNGNCPSVQQREVNTFSRETKNCCIVERKNMFRNLKIQRTSACQHCTSEPAWTAEA